MLVGFVLELVVEILAGAGSCSMGARKESLQRFEHCILQTGNEERGYQRLEDKGKKVNGRTRLGQRLFPPCCATGGKGRMWRKGRAMDDGRQRKSRLGRGERWREHCRGAFESDSLNPCFCLA